MPTLAARRDSRPFPAGIHPASANPHAAVVLIAMLTLLLTALLIPSTSLAADPSPAEAPVPSSDQTSELVIPHAVPVALGAIRGSGEHLVRPREGVVERTLRDRGAITTGMPAAAVRAAKAAYHEEFARASRAWVSPAVQIRALGVRQVPTPTLPAAASAPSPQTCAKVQPVTAKILVLAVEFGGSDTFTYYGRDATGCKTLTVTTSGPLKGEIPPPGDRDNNTVWYDPAKTAKAAFYGDLIFGRRGVGRVRTDLIDPVDHQAGINLAGYTVQDYFDHMAGVGNVTLGGSVQGWVTVPHSEGYYGAQGCSPSKHDGAGPASRGQLVVDALQKFMDEHPEYYTDGSPDAFWRQFDANHDGVVDSLWVIHAGMGQEALGGLQGDFAMWSHSGDLRDYPEWQAGFPVHQGDNGTAIVVGPYTMLPENVDLGTLVEEFGHNFFGLPDLYTVDIENSIGFWSIMASGSWTGWLGGATPVGMPLWFRMIAQCGEDTPCNWHLPLRTLAHNDPTRTVTIGRLESTPEGAYKGLRINLPDVAAKGTLNRAGTGKGAYTGTGLNNLDITLKRSLTIPAAAKELTLASFWDIEADHDYGYVMILDGGKWIFLKDLDGAMTDTNPYGANLGFGLTGGGSRKLRFDVTPYRGKKVTLRFRYKTDGAVTQPGWWVDNVALDGRSVTAFEAASLPATFPKGWRISTPGWQVVPTATTSYPNYYLVEWRTATKYDRMLRTAYAKNVDEPNEWQVERVPYNIPGAVLYYCNHLYIPDDPANRTTTLSTNLTAPPSIGPKAPLLVVDMNYQPMPLDNNGTILDSRIASYDAALTRQAAKPFTISQLVTDGGTLEGPWTFASKPPATVFDDALGYYAGLFAGPPCESTYCYANEGGSAVIPAMGKYSTRITHFDGTPYPELYGKKYKGSTLGTGNPGDDGVQWGVRLKLLRKSADNQRATLRVNAQPAASE